MTGKFYLEGVPVTAGTFFALTAVRPHVDAVRYALRFGGVAEYRNGVLTVARNGVTVFYR